MPSMGQPGARDDSVLDTALAGITEEEQFDSKD